MRSLIAAAALGCVLETVAAQGPFKWNQDAEARNWHPARETPEAAYMPVLGMRAAAPAPTPPAKADSRRLARRSLTDNTCAFVSGSSDQSLYCNPDSACVFNSVRSNIGCCPDSSLSCPIWTKCYDSTDSASYTTSNGYTLYCGNATYPSCLTHEYKDSLFSGYSLLGCGRTGGTDIVYYSATDAPTTTAKSTSSTPSVVTKTASIGTASATESSSSGVSTVAVAPVVGGVVGGVAILGLIALGIVFLLRRKPKSTAGPGTAMGPNDGMASANSPAYAAAGAWSSPGAPMQSMQQMYGGPPPAGAPGFVPVDPRLSMAKPPVAGDPYLPSMSPPPQPQSSPSVVSDLYGATTPPSQQQYHYAPGMGYQSGPVPGAYVAAELDGEGKDRQPRELE